MTKRPPKLPPPTRQEREAAAIAAEALIAALADPTTRGVPSVMVLDLGRPRRGERHIQVNDRYSHACLPGWEYTKAEIALEMIPDLQALAEHGVRPCLPTDGKPLTPDLFGVMS